MADARRVLVTGATGLVGTRLVAALVDEDWRVAAPTRRPERARLPLGAEALGWDGVRVPDAALAGCEAVVHLAGEPIFGGLPSAARRARIRESRVASTRALVEALARRPEAERPRVLVCASAVGYYGDRGEAALDEDAPPGAGFLAEVCAAWEEAARAAEAHGVRTVSLRIGVVLAREGGALPALARVFRLGLGGRLASGRQWFPWIHVDDLVRMIAAALDDARWRGPVNAVAPHPVRNAQLTRALARAVRRPALIPVPAAPLRLALGVLAGELLDSRRVLPRRAADLGFTWRYETLERALAAELA